MGTIFTLTPAIKKVIQNALDDLITELGKPCRLYYPGKVVPCPNCVFDSTNQRGGLTFKNGGSVPFPNGTICPVCNGKDLKISQTSEVINMLCAWEPKNFWHPIPSLDIRVPFSLVQTKGYLIDLPKLVKCDYMIFDVDIEGYVSQKFKLVSMPGDRSNIIQGRYFVCTWEQVP